MGTSGRDGRRQSCVFAIDTAEADAFDILIEEEQILLLLRKLLMHLLVRIGIQAHPVQVVLNQITHQLLGMLLLLEISSELLRTVHALELLYLGVVGNHSAVYLLLNLNDQYQDSFLSRLHERFLDCQDNGLFQLVSRLDATKLL